MPAYNAWQERNELIDFVCRLPPPVQLRLHTNLADQTYMGTLDYLNPDCVHLYIGTQDVRRALLTGCIAHITAQANAFIAPEGSTVLARTPNGDELRCTSDGRLVLIEDGMSATHYAPNEAAKAWRAFAAQARARATGCPF